MKPKCFGRLEMIFHQLKKYRALIFLLLAFAILRIPSLFEPNRYADEEIYLTLGRGLRQGLMFYRDIHDNKPPFLYLVAAVAGNLFGLRLILLIAQAIGVVFFWKLAELIFEKKMVFIFTASLIFGLFSTLPTLEGNIANGENFMIVPGLAAVYLIYKSVSQDEKNTSKKSVCFGVGLLFACAFLFKIPIIFDFFGVLLFWLLFSEPKLKIDELVKNHTLDKFVFVLLGFSLPIIISIAYYAANGAFEPYVRSALLQNIGYLSSWEGERGETGFLANPLVWKGLVVGAIILAVTVLAGKLSRRLKLVIIWLALAMYGALLSSRPYPHYLLEPLAPLTLLIVLVIFEKKRLTSLMAGGMLMIVSLAYIKSGFWKYETVSYYGNFLNYLSGDKSRDDYLNYFGALDNYRVADYLNKTNETEDKDLFVWGTEPAIYTLTNSLPTGRYTVAYHIVDFQAYDETIEAIKSNFPNRVVMIKNAPEFIELEKLVKQEYVWEKEFPTANIYLKN